MGMQGEMKIKESSWVQMNQNRKEGKGKLNKNGREGRWEAPSDEGPE